MCRQRAVRTEYKVEKLVVTTRCAPCMSAVLYRVSLNCPGVCMHMFATPALPHPFLFQSQQMVSGLPNWVRLWTILRQNQLRCWTFPEDVGNKMHVFNMTLTEVSSARWRHCDIHLRTVYMYVRTYVSPTVLCTYLRMSTVVKQQRLLIEECLVHAQIRISHTCPLAVVCVLGLQCVALSSCMSVPSLLLQGMTVENAPRLSIRRPNALVVKGGQQEHYIAFESKEERADWAKVRVCVCAVPLHREQ